MSNLLRVCNHNQKEQTLDRVSKWKEIYERIMNVLGTKGTKGGSEYAKLVK